MGSTKSIKDRKTETVLILLSLSLLTGMWFFIPSAETLHPPTHVVISEIQIQEMEFIELYNPTETPIIMEGWHWCFYSTSRDWEAPSYNHAFPAGATIPANGFYLIATNRHTYPSADWNLNYGDYILSDATGSIAIYPFNPEMGTPQDARDGRIDAVGWGTARHVFEGSSTGNHLVGQSIQRKNLSWDYGPAQDTDNNSIDFEIIRPPTPMNTTSPPIRPLPKTAPVAWLTLGTPSHVLDDTLWINGNVSNRTRYTTTEQPGFTIPQLFTPDLILGSPQIIQWGNEIITGTTTGAITGTFTMTLEGIILQNTTGQGFSRGTFSLANTAHNGWYNGTWVSDTSWPDIQGKIYLVGDGIYNGQTLQGLVIGNYNPLTFDTFSAGLSLHPATHITTATTITINATDIMDAVSQESYTIFYRIWDSAWGATQNSSLNTSISLTFPHEGQYYLEWWVIDSLNNEAPHLNITLYVDDTPPEIQVTLGTPISGDYITTATEFNLTSTDMPLDYGVGLQTLEYRIWHHETGWGSWTPYIGNFTLTEECTHYLQITATDFLGNTNTTNHTYYVDTTPPVSSYHIETLQNLSYVNLSTPVSLTARDEGICSSGSWRLWYRTWNTSWSEWHQGAWNTNITLYFTEGCTHYIEWYSEDSLGNMEGVHNQTFYVDENPPTTTLYYTDPYFSAPYWDGQNNFIAASRTMICFNASDPSPCNSDIRSIWYQLWVWNLSSQVWTILPPGELLYFSEDGNGTGPFTINQSGIYLLEYWSIDKVGNKEDVFTQVICVDESPVNLILSYPDDIYDAKFLTTDDRILVETTDMPEGTDSYMAYDQWQITWNGHNSIQNIPYYDFQQFTPQVSSLDAIRVLISGGPGTITLHVYDIFGGDWYLNETIPVTYPEPTWILFTFPPNVTLTPGETHFFELLSNDVFEWYYWNGSDDRYPCGEGRRDWAPFGGDWAFITHYWIPYGEKDTLPYTSQVQGLYWRYEVLGEQYPYEGDVNATNGSSINPLDPAIASYWWYHSIEDGIQFKEECNHSLYLLPVDNVYNHHILGPSFYHVDITPPATTLEYGTPHYTESTDTWITAATPIWLNATDEGPCKVGEYELFYRLWNYSAGWSPWQSSGPNTNVLLYLPEDCHNYIEFYSLDSLGNNESGAAWIHLNNHTFLVDNTPPSSLVDPLTPFIQPTVPFNIHASGTDTYCITNGSGIASLELWYKYSADLITWGNWTHYADDFQGPWEWAFYAPNGAGYYQFYSRATDSIGNQETAPLTNDTWVHVTGEPPTTTLTVGDPHSIAGNWITSHTPLSLTALDPDGNTSHIITKYRVFNVHNHTWSPTWTTYTGSFTVQGDCTHYIEYYSMDNNGTGEYNTEILHNDTLYVDDTSPVGSVAVGTPSWWSGDGWYVNLSTPIWINVTNDVGECIVPSWHVYVNVWYEGSWVNTTYDDVDSVLVDFAEECQHYLVWWVEDDLGNRILEENHTFYVDDTSPVGSVAVGTPSWWSGDGWYVNLSTPIWINVTNDVGECIVPSWHVYVNVWYEGSWVNTTYDDVDSVLVDFAEECQHYLVWWVEDDLGNRILEENHIFYVDNTPAITHLAFGNPVSSHNGTPWITTHTPLYLNATLGEGGGAIGYQIYYRIWNIDTGWGPWTSGEWDTPLLIYPEEECQHHIQYYLIDALGGNESEPGWTNLHNHTFYVDDTSPVGSVAVGTPSWWSGDGWYVNLSTPIWINVTNDVGECIVPSWHVYVNVWYEGSWVNTTYDDVDSVLVDFAEECQHYLVWWVEDDLGNRILEENHTFYVDDTPPSTLKEYGEPFLTIGEDHYITLQTPFYINATDPGTCSINNCLVHYRLWTSTTGWLPWKTGEQGENIIFTLAEELGGFKGGIIYNEYYSLDSLGNNESAPHWSNVKNNTLIFVDSEPPEITDIMDTPDPQEVRYLGMYGWVNITCTVTDNTQVNTVKVNITQPDGLPLLNTSMTKNGDTYYYNATYTTTGQYTYSIWADDLLGNPNTSSLFTFDVQAVHINVTPSTHDIPVGDTFTINITVTPVHPIAGVQLDLLFNPSLLQAIHVTEGNLFDGSTSTFYNGTIDNTNGTITGIAGAVIVPGGSISSPGTFITITFTAQYVLGISPLTLTNLLVGHPDAQPAPIVPHHGTVTLIDNTPPVISDVLASPQYQTSGGCVNVSGSVVDNVAVDEVFLMVMYPDLFVENFSIMGNRSGNRFYCNRSYTQPGQYQFSLWANDTSGNQDASLLQSFYIYIPNVTIVYLSPGISYVQPGETFPVNISIIPGEPIAGAQFNLSFDSAAIVAHTVTEGTLFTGLDTYFIDGTVDNVLGQISGVAGAVITPDGSMLLPGTFATVTFTAGYTRGLSHLNLSNVIVGNKDAFSLPVSVVDVLSHGAIIIDDTPPVTIKEIGQPHYSDGLWVTTGTPITLQAEDDQSGISGTYYRIWHNGSWTLWTEYTGSFTFDEECMHYLEFYSVDNAGNTEDIQNQTHYVDDTPPAVSKTVGWPRMSAGTGDWFISNTTMISGTDDAPATVWFNVSDTGGECNVGNFLVNVSVEFLGDLIWSHEQYVESGWINVSIPQDVFDSECMHNVSVLVVDCLGNLLFDNETFYVDNSPPVTVKEYGSPQYDQGGDMFITTGTLIWLNASDANGICSVEDLDIFYRIWNNMTGWSSWMAGGFNNVSVAVSVGEECRHYIEYYARDALGNMEMVQNQTFYVDDTPPVTIKTYGQPQYLQNQTMYLTTGTPIWLNATDENGSCTVGDYLIYYRIWDHTWGWSPWHTSTGINTDVIRYPSEECKHYIEYYTLDALGNTESLHNQTFYVDDVPPSINLTMGWPRKSAGGNNWYITNRTLINSTTGDPEPATVWINITDTLNGCSVGNLHVNATVEYQGILIWDYLGYMDSGWLNVSIPQWVFMTDCQHNLSIRVWDCLNNTLWDNRTLYVDNIHPLTIKTYGDFYYNIGQDIYISTTTPIYLNASDGGTCKIDTYEIYYRIWNNATGWSSWISGGQDTDLTIYVGEECKHYIEYYAVDTLGNNESWENLHNQTFFVDNTPPTSTIENGGPELIEITEYVAGYKLFDQYQNTSTYDSADLSNGPPIPLDFAQSFIPQNNIIDAVNVSLSWSGPDNVTAFILNGTPSIIGWKTLTFNGSSTQSVWVQFEFDSQINVTIGNPYYIALNSSHSNVTWWSEDGNPYPSGEQYFSGTLQSDVDFAFKTEYYPILNYTKKYVSLKTPIFLNSSDEGCNEGTGAKKAQITIWLDDDNDDLVNDSDIIKDFMVNDNDANDTNPALGVIDVQINFQEGCHHLVAIQSWDYVGNLGALYTEWYYVDDTPPNISKTVGWPRWSAGGGDWFISNETVINGTAGWLEPAAVWFNVTDSVDVCSVGNFHVNISVVFMDILVWSEEHYVDSGWINVSVPQWVFDSECVHTVSIHVWDCLNNSWWDNESFYVDNTAPSVSKTVGWPRWSAGGDDWFISNETVINGTTDDALWINVTDSGMGCSVANFHVNISVEFLGTPIWSYTDYVDSGWINVSVPQWVFDSECVHTVSIHVWDCLNNSWWDNESFYVDNSPPVTVKEYGSPQYDQGGDMFITTGTLIWLNATDTSGICSVDDLELFYRIWNNMTGWSSWMAGGFNNVSVAVSVGEECRHYIEYYARDALGNKELVHNQTFYVDDTPPTVVSKTVGWPRWSAGGGDWFISNRTVINGTAGWLEPAAVWFNVTDSVDVCSVGNFHVNVSVEYLGILVWWNETYVDAGWVNVSVPQWVFEEECVHTVSIHVWDCLNNSWWDNETFYVDNSPPSTMKEYGTPSHSEGLIQWINMSTPIYLNSTDNGECPVQNYTIFYRIWNNLSGWSQWYSGSLNTNIAITVHEECKHFIEYYTVDTLGNTETTHNQTFYVDNTPPGYSKSIGDPKFQWIPSDPEYGKWVTTQTPITLSGYDRGNCTQGSWRIGYRIWNNGSWTSWIHGNWDTDVIMNFTEECIHYLEWYSEDILGNKIVHNQTHHVDNTPPRSYKMVGHPSHGSNQTYVTTHTPITLTANDYGPDNLTADDYGACAVESWRIHWEIWMGGHMVGSGSGGWYQNVTLFFTEEGNHTLVWWAEDNLGNLEQPHIQIHHVDDTMPISTKIIGQPSYDRCGDGIPEYVTTSTPLILTALDGGECPVDSWRIHWEIWMGDILIDNGTGDWCTNVTIYFTEECTHTLIWWAEDDLGNTEPPHTQVHIVDDTPPIVTKEIGQPQYTLCGPPIGGCPSGGIIFVTTGTPIYINATDPSGCTSGIQEIHYLITYPNGTQTEFIGYTDEIIFTFSEEGCHTIEIWAVDNLGNTGGNILQIHGVDDHPPATWKEHIGPSYVFDDMLTINTTLSANESLITNVTGGFILPQVFGEDAILPAATILWNTQTWMGNTSGALTGNITFYHHAIIPRDTLYAGMGFSRGNFTWTDTLGGSFTGYYVADITNYSQLHGRLYAQGEGTKAGEYLEGEFTGQITSNGGIGLDWLNTTMWFHNVTWVSLDTTISINATDLYNPCSVGSYQIFYRYYLEGSIPDVFMAGPLNESVQFSFNEECEHLLEWYLVDDLGTISDIYYQRYYVDDTSPVINKTVGWPRYPAGDGDWYITSQTLINQTSNTSLWINITDSTDNCSIGNFHVNITVDYECNPIWWNYTYTDSGWINISIPQWVFEEECIHNISIHVWDCLDNDWWDNETFYVDNTPPDTTKTYGLPNYTLLSGDTYISSSTPIILNATEEERCDVGHQTIFYRLWNLSGWSPWKSSGENTTLILYVPEECKHIIEYYAVDALGNIEATHNQTFYVDNHPPATWKEHIWTGSEGGMYMDSNGIDINTTLLNDTRYYSNETPGFTIPQVFGTDLVLPATTTILWNDQIWTGTTSGDLEGNITLYHHSIIPTEGIYLGVGFSQGTFLWNDDNGTFTGYYVADHNGPYIDTRGRIYAWGGGVYTGQYIEGEFNGTVENSFWFNASMIFQYARWVRLDTQIVINATDLYGPCSVGSYQIFYRTYLNGSLPGNFTAGPENASVIFNFTEECEHILEWYVVDDLGIESVHYYQRYYVDDTPPTTIKEYGTPSYTDGSMLWINATTPIYLNVTDPGLCAVDHSQIWYRVWNNITGWTSWQNGGYNSSVIIYAQEECQHYIEYYSVDSLGNNESGTGWEYLHNQTFSVDTTYPLSYKAIGDPKYSWIPTDSHYGRWVATETPITLTGMDQGNCTTGQWRIQWEIWLNNGTTSYLIDHGTGEWNTPEIIYFGEECNHTLVWWAEDNVLNKEPEHIQIHLVDDTPPTSLKIIGEPAYDEYLTNQTPVIITATDPGDSAVYNWRIWYRIWNGTWTAWDHGNWNTNVTVFFPEECTHYLEWYAEDNLGNREMLQNQTHKVDVDPPATTKTIGMPHWNNGTDLLNTTMIWLNSTDQGNCTSGVDYLHYEIWWDSDNDTILERIFQENITTGHITFSFSDFGITTGSCEIRWYSSDHVNNIESSTIQPHTVLPPP